MYVSTDPRFVFVEIPRTGSRSLSRLWPRLSRRGTQFNHHRTQLPEYVDRSYLIFAVVRNPFVRELSHYLHRRRHPKNNYHLVALKNSFKEYLKRMIDVEPCQASMLDGKPGLLVLRYENGLEQEIRKLPFVPEGITIPHIHKNKPYCCQDYYDEQTANIVLEHAGEDFTRYGYDKQSWRQL